MSSWMVLNGHRRRSLQNNNIMEEKQKKVIVTGAQPTGMFHLGNYLGAVKNWRTLQHDYECFFFIPNLHSITVPPYVPAELRKRTYSMLAQYLACGLPRTPISRPKMKIGSRMILIITATIVAVIEKRG